MNDDMNALLDTLISFLCDLQKTMRRAHLVQMAADAKHIQLLMVDEADAGAIWQATADLTSEVTQHVVTVADIVDTLKTQLVGEQIH